MIRALVERLALAAVAPLYGLLEASLARLGDSLVDVDLDAEADRIVAWIDQARAEGRVPPLRVAP